MKRLLIFNLFAFICLSNFIKGSDSLSRKVRQVILNRSNQEQIATLGASNEKTFINKIPFDIRQEILTFLDFKSLLNLKVTCKSLENDLNEYFKLKINSICPKCILQDTFVNGLIYLILKENIPPKISIDNPEIYDYLALMIIKYISDDYKPKEIPRLVYHHILQFLFEIIYETDESIPVYEETWRDWLVFKLQKYSLPRTLDYFIKIRKETYDRRQNWNFDQWKAILEFVAMKPNLSDQRRFLIENNLYSHTSVVTLPQEFSCFFFASLHKQLVSDESVPLVFLKVLNCNYMTKSLLRRLTPDNYDTLLKNMELYTITRDLSFKRFVVKNYEWKYSPSLVYIWSRDDMKRPFNPNEFGNFDSREVLYDIANTPSPKLVHIEIFSYLIRNTLFQQISFYDDNLVQYLSVFKNHLYWDILLHESELPVNLFYMSANGMKYHVYNNEFRAPYSVYDQNIKIFVRSLSKEHPLPLLFLHVTVLERVKHLIVDKFNLGQSYIFDGLFEDFQFENLNEELKEQIHGKVMRFIDILMLINNERLNDVFFSDNHLEIIENSKVYSVSKFLNSAIFEEIQ